LVFAPVPAEGAPGGKAQQTAAASSTPKDVDAKIAACRQRAHRFGSQLFVFAAREGLELKLDI
jgi:hypothetical protein